MRLHALPAAAGLSIVLVLDNRIGSVREVELEQKAGETGHLFDEASQPIAYVDQRKIVRANAAFSSIVGGTTGLTADGRDLRNVFAPHALSLIRKCMKSPASAPETGRIEGELQTADGQKIWSAIRISRARHGGRECFLLHLENVEQYRSAINSLRESEHLFRRISEQIAHAAALLRDGRIAYANPELVKLLGWADDKPISGKPLEQIMTQASGEAFSPAWEKFVASRQRTWSVEKELVTAEGKQVSVALTFNKGDASNAKEVVVSVQDVTEFRERERKVLQVHSGTEQIKGILESATAGADPDRVIQAALTRSLDVLGWSGGAVYLRDERTRTYSAAFHRAYPKNLLTGISGIPADEGLGGFVSKTLESHVFTIRRYPSYLPYRTLFDKNRVGSI
ncbi:MAG TPA: PAS domain-containing protein, partial [Candidatus Krumholzibacterium sp.]|nr:PAS domain-containing protein [Candidatus Krumholzibacterium sp.]